MLSRCLQGTLRSRQLRPRRCQLWHLRHRSLSSSTYKASSHSAAVSQPLVALTTDLDRIASRIDLDAAQIEVLNDPKEFYEVLKSKISRAKKRIYLSTLYIGKTEHEFVATIREALRRNGPELKVSILTDALRGGRESPEPSCASLLASLVEEFPEQVEVRMYHTPNLTGLRKALVPKRINEGWGLQHMKLYGVDDELILSGANLSNDYFSNRQDRYHVFRSKRVTDHFLRIHNTVCSLSFQLEPSSAASRFELVWPAANPAPNPLQSPKKYIQAATSLLEPFTTPQQPSPPKPTSNDTSLYPLLVHPPTLNNELPVFTALFKQRPLHSYTFTAGYFNPHPAITSSLLAASSPPTSVPGTILSASPQANGFYGSKGISGMLPPAYTHLFSQFLKAARGKSMQMREWRYGTVCEAGGWTYHAKGVWITLPPPTHGPAEEPSSNNAEAIAGPSATLIGSSNYTTRSYGLDLEVGALVVTSDEGLMRKWRKEEENLLKHTRVVTEGELDSLERRANWRVKLAMWIVKLVGGSL